MKRATPVVKRLHFGSSTLATVSLSLSLSLSLSHVSRSVLQKLRLHQTLTPHTQLYANVLVFKYAWRFFCDWELVVRKKKGNGRMRFSFDLVGFSLINVLI